jgi:hypothetical protein
MLGTTGVMNGLLEYQPCLASSYARSRRAARDRRLPLGPGILHFDMELVARVAKRIVNEVRGIDQALHTIGWR